jgi:hypothetical protein
MCGIIGLLLSDENQHVSVPLGDHILVHWFYDNLQHENASHLYVLL